MREIEVNYGVIHHIWNAHHHNNHSFAMISSVRDALMNVGIITGNGFLFFTKQNKKHTHAHTRKKNKQRLNRSKKHLFSKLAINSGKITGIEHYDCTLNLFSVYFSVSLKLRTQNWGFIKLYLGHTPRMAIIFMRFLLRFFINEWKVQFDVKQLFWLNFMVVAADTFVLVAVFFTHFFWKLNCFHF